MTSLTLGMPTLSGTRVVAVLTEDSRARYGWRCAECHTLDIGVTHLHLAAEWAHRHTVATGHETTVEVEG